MMLRRTVLIRVGLRRGRRRMTGGNLNEGFWKRVPGKEYYYMYQSSSSIFTEGEGEVRWAVHTHTHIKSDIVLYFKERFTSISPTSMTALHHCSSRRAS